MKFIAWLSFLHLLVGCSSIQTIEMTSIRVRPIEIEVVVVSAKPIEKKEGLRTELGVKVISPKLHSGKTLTLIVDTFQKKHDILNTGTQWILSFDEEGFEHQDRVGFSFWDLSELKPRKTQQNHAVVAIGASAPIATL